jgi:DNA-binding response OmpR family regulator
MVNCKNILIVDDESLVTEFLSAYLSKNGYTTYCAHSGKTAQEIFRTIDISLVLLDLMLPDMTGEELCKVFRSTSRVPIIMLTAKVQESDILEGLRHGADDYLTKPFSPRIVVAKVEAVLRRVECDNLASVPVTYKNNLTIDFQNGIVKKHGDVINLTPTEFKILSTMANAPGRIFTRDQLISFALGDEFSGFDRSIDSYIKGLRSKIEDNRKRPQHIITVHGTGYKFNTST